MVTASSTIGNHDGGLALIPLIMNAWRELGASEYEARMNLSRGFTTRVLEQERLKSQGDLRSL
jgi:hypothetical protein